MVIASDNWCCLAWFLPGHNTTEGWLGFEDKISSMHYWFHIRYIIGTYCECLYVPKLRTPFSRSLLAMAWRSTLKRLCSSNPRDSTQLQDEAKQQRYRADWSSTNVTGLKCKCIPKENWGLDNVHGGDVTRKESCRRGSSREKGKR